MQERLCYQKDIGIMSPLTGFKTSQAEQQVKFGIKRARHCRSPLSNQNQHVTLLHDDLAFCPCPPANSRSSCSGQAGNLGHGEDTTVNDKSQELCSELSSISRGPDYTTCSTFKAPAGLGGRVIICVYSITYIYIYIYIIYIIYIYIYCI